MRVEKITEYANEILSPKRKVFMVDSQKQEVQALLSALPQVSYMSVT